MNLTRSLLLLGVMLLCGRAAAGDLNKNTFERIIQEQNEQDDVTTVLDAVQALRDQTGGKHDTVVGRMRAISDGKPYLIKQGETFKTKT